MRQVYIVLTAAAVALLVGSGLGEAEPLQKGNPHIASTPPRTPEEQVKLFHLPPGFVIELVVAEPLISKPINIAFDAEGNLWVTETVEYPFPAAPGKGRDGVKILRQIAADGRARKVVHFAGGLNIPIGVLPLGNSALVFSIPGIYKLSDTKGAGKADKQEMLYSGYGYKDTHGMTGEFMHGFDGWVYACHGFSNTSKVKAADGSAITMQSGNTYRIKADGSHIEYFTHGQVNPFGLAFDPLGNVYSCDCHSRPIYQLLKGAYYPSFGKPHDGLGFGPEMLTHDHGSTAIAGIAYYAADQFPPEYRDNIFIGNVVTNRINRDRLEKHGSTYKAIQMPDFVKCDDPWFRPVDIKLGPDGALYVADFYNRIIGHYEVALDHPGRDRERGRIWRIRYAGADGKTPVPPIPNLAKASVKELVGALGSPNLTVRLTATHQLVERGGKEGVAAARKLFEGVATPEQRAHALWVLARQSAMDPKLLTAAGNDESALVRTHNQRVLAEAPTWDIHQSKYAQWGLRDRDAFVQRCAAEAMGAHPQAANLQPLLALRLKIPAADTHLLHVVRMALRDQLKPSPQVKNVWKQMHEREWKDEEARALADVCPGVHTAEAADFLLAHLKRLPESNGNTLRYAHHVARYGSDDPGAKLVDLARTKFGKDLGMQAALFKSIQQGTQERGAPLSQAVRDWAEALTNTLITSGDGKLVAPAVEMAGLLKTENLERTLLGLLQDAKQPEATRRAAVVAVVAINPTRQAAALGRVLNDAAEPIPLREQVAASLAGTNQPAAHAELLKALQNVPARLETAIATGLAGSPQGAERLLDAVAKGKASARLLQDRGVELRLKQAKVPDLAARLTRLTKGLPAADERVAKLIAGRRNFFEGAKKDEQFGKMVFDKHCASCHQIANQGSKIGPQLDGIGIRGVDRILEDILDPNRNVDQAFRSTVLTLTDGKVVNGLLLREEGKVLILADAQGKEQRIPAADVESRVVVPLSPMPANFAETINDNEFTHLLAYLLAQRAPGTKQP
jgi:putative heme-binding domain-containing protein